MNYEQRKAARRLEFAQRWQRALASKDIGLIMDVRSLQFTRVSEDEIRTDLAAVRRDMDERLGLIPLRDSRVKAERKISAFPFRAYMVMLREKQDQ